MYKNKYLKYKNKYLNLKKPVIQMGGFTVEEIKKLLRRYNSYYSAAKEVE
jgi:hypothetical protein